LHGEKARNGSTRLLRDCRRLLAGESPGIVAWHLQVRLQATSYSIVAKGAVACSSHKKTRDLSIPGFLCPLPGRKKIVT